MAMEVDEVRHWINTLGHRGKVAVDDGGLALVFIPDDASFQCEGKEAYEFPSWLEIGGTPLDEKED